MAFQFRFFFLPNYGSRSRDYNSLAQSFSCVQTHLSFPCKEIRLWVVHYSEQDCTTINNYKHYKKKKKNRIKSQIIPLLQIQHNIPKKTDKAKTQMCRQKCESSREIQVCYITARPGGEKRLVKQRKGSQLSNVFLSSKFLPELSRKTGMSMPGKINSSSLHLFEADNT